MRTLFNVSLLLVLLVTEVAMALPKEGLSIKIGVVQSLTGIAAQDGNTVVRSLEIAADDLRKQGVDVSLLIEDDMFDPKATVSAFRKLLSEKVDAVIGATWSVTTNALAPLAASERMVLMNTSTLPEALNYKAGGGYLFSNALALDPESAPFGDYLRARHFSSAILLQNGSAWGEALAEKHKKFLESAKIPLLRQIKGNKSDDNQWDELLPLVKASSPELIVVLSGKQDTERILRRSHELSIEVAFFASKNTMDAWRFSKNRQSFDNSLCFSYPLSQLRKAKDFYSEYQKRYSEDPAIYSDNSYDVLYILAEAISLSRSSGKTLSEILKQSSFKGVAGSYNYSEISSLGGGRSSLLCFHDGKPEIEDPK